MKRKRETGNVTTEIRSAIEELILMVKLNPVLVKPSDSSAFKDGTVVDDDDDDDKGHKGDLPHPPIPTRPFLSLCSLVVQVLDKIGPTMSVLRQDIDQNIQRMEAAYESEPSTYSNIEEILKMEAREVIARKITSSSRAFVWLTRTMNFTLALLKRLATDPAISMEDAVEDAYAITLKPWHGWISLAAFRIATKLVPDNKTFIDLLASRDETRERINEEILTFVSLLTTFLDRVQSVLKLYNLDRIKSK